MERRWNALGGSSLTRADCETAEPGISAHVELSEGAFPAPDVDLRPGGGAGEDERSFRRRSCFAVLGESTFLNFFFHLSSVSGMMLIPSDEGGRERKADVAEGPK
jgi:hypothetical protein